MKADIAVKNKVFGHPFGVSSSLTYEEQMALASRFVSLGFYKLLYLSNKIADFQINDLIDLYDCCAVGMRTTSQQPKSKLWYPLMNLNGV